MRGLARLAAAALLACPAAAQEPSFAELERGRYLATAANCVGCHTDFERDGPLWGGGRELETPFGAIITPNITFDDTGIGAWSRDDFWRLMHEGVRRDGAQIYPAMPYPYFTRMPRADVDAIYAYLRSLPSVRAEHDPAAELPAPLRIREGVRVWKALNFDQGVFQPDPEKSEAWNRGAYLVQGPTHCGACHTAKNILGGDRQNEFLRGGVLENWLAPNIRGGANGGIAHWSEADIVSFLRQGRNAHTGSMRRMGEVVTLSMQHLEEEDLRAIATYLKDLDDPGRPAAAAPDADVAAAGEAIYFDNCAACHRTDGSGVPGVFAVLDGSNKVRSEDASTVIRIILEGAQAVATEARPGPLGMPAFDWKLDDAQVAAVVSYIRNAWSNDAAAVSESDVADMRETLTD